MRLLLSAAAWALRRSAARWMRSRRRRAAHSSASGTAAHALRHDASAPARSRRSATTTARWARKRRRLVTKPLEAAICARKPVCGEARGPAWMRWQRARNTRCPYQLSLEERMGCGIGACLGCNVKIMQPDGRLAREARLRTARRVRRRGVSAWLDLSLDLCGVKLKNPIIAASGIRLWPRAPTSLRTSARLWRCFRRG